MKMKRVLMAILAIMIISSCTKERGLSEVCKYKYDILSPIGYDLKMISEIEFNGNVREFQFVNDQIGYALLGNNVGGYIEVFKSINGGETWTDLNFGIKKISRGMEFKDENIGVITILDVTGCPSPNCQHKCVVLKTVDGGLSWKEIEVENLKGALYQPRFDSDGNLYAFLAFENQSKLMKSTDDGETWSELMEGQVFNSIYRYRLFDDNFYIPLNDGKILIVDTNGNILKTIETGVSKILDVKIFDNDNLMVTNYDEIIKTTDGGEAWETMYSGYAKIIGFDSPNNGIIMLKQSSCPEDVVHVNDLIAVTNDGGESWVFADEATTNLSSNFRNSQKMADGNWYFMVKNQLFTILEE